MRNVSNQMRRVSIGFLTQVHLRKTEGGVASRDNFSFEGGNGRWRNWKVWKCRRERTRILSNFKLQKAIYQHWESADSDISPRSQNSTRAQGDNLERDDEGIEEKRNTRYLCSLCSGEEHREGFVCEDLKYSERLFSGNKDFWDPRYDKYDVSLNLLYKDKSVIEKVVTAKDLIMMHPSIEAVEQTVQSKELGKYVIVYKEGGKPSVSKWTHWCDMWICEQL